jgi:hypothetical protein
MGSISDVENYDYDESDHVESREDRLFEDVRMLVKFVKKVSKADNWIPNSLSLEAAKILEKVTSINI